MNFQHLICFVVLTFVRLNEGKYLLIRILKPDVPPKALPTSKQRIGKYRYILKNLGGLTNIDINILIFLFVCLSIYRFNMS